MKKTFVFIFAFFYLGISCGFALDIHFCMGKFSSMEFYHSKKDKCGKCGMNTKNSCCNDKVTVVKLTDNQQISSNSLQLTSSFALPLYSYDSGNLISHISSLRKILLADMSSPPVPGAFRCILNSVFII